MTKFKSDELIDRLEADIRQIIQAAEHLRKADPVKLSYAPAEGKWSAVEVLEHLNIYNRFYNATIEKAMVPIGKEMNAWFISGFWGNYFTNMMKPKTVYEVGKKMKTLKNQRPGKSLNVDKVFTEFFQHQNKLLQLLEIARKRNLNTIKIPISISRLMKFKLGDTFRFLIAHEQRHMIQARNAIHAVGVPTDKFPVILEAAQL